MTSRKALADPADPYDRDPPVRHDRPLSPRGEPRSPAATRPPAQDAPDAPHAGQDEDLLDDGSARPLPNPDEEGRV